MFRSISVVRRLWLGRHERTGPQLKVVSTRSRALRVLVDERDAVSLGLTYTLMHGHKGIAMADTPRLGLVGGGGRGSCRGLPALGFSVPLCRFQANLERRVDQFA